MAKQIIDTKHAPTAIGTYSQAVRVDNLIFVSGQIPLDPETESLVEGDLIVQTQRIFKNIEAIALACGTTLQHLIRLGVYLTDINDFNTVNQIFNELIEPPFPARSLIEVSALPKGAKIEIDAILALNI